MFRTDQEGVRGDAIYQGIQVACALEAVAAEIWHQERAVLDGRRRVEEEDRLRAQVEEAWRRKHAEIAVESGDGVIAAWRAADESDPFASIRGDFDLSSPTAAWETSLQLPDAEQCVLLKTPAAAGMAALHSGRSRVSSTPPLTHMSASWNLSDPRSILPTGLTKRRYK